MTVLALLFEETFFSITGPFSGNDDEEDAVGSADCSSQGTSEEIDEQLGEGLNKHVSLGSTLNPSSK